MVNIANVLFYFIDKEKGRGEELEWLPYPLRGHSNILPAESEGNW